MLVHIIVKIERTGWCECRLILDRLVVLSSILINERLVYEDVFTSIHIERYDIDIEQNDDVSEQITSNIPNLSFSETQNLNEDGIVELGTFVKPGDILVGKIVAKNDSEQLPEAKLLRAIFGAKAKGVRDTSFRMPKGKHGRVIDRVTFNRRTKLSTMLS